MRLIAATLLVLSALTGTFSQKPVKATKTAPPKIVYTNAKARHKQLRTEVLNRIIKPLLCESEVPVSDITVDFCPEMLGSEEKRGCQNEAKGELTISVTVNWEDGSSGVRWIDIKQDGAFEKDADLGFLSGMPRKTCVGRDNK
jgi:hypothetical protein